MYCGKCGSPIPNGNSFCSNCGAPISNVVTPTAVKVNLPPMPQSEQKSQPHTSAGRVIETILVIILVIIVVGSVLRACTVGMIQMGY